MSYPCVRLRFPFRVPHRVRSGWVRVPLSSSVLFFVFLSGFLFVVVRFPFRVLPVSSVFVRVPLRFSPWSSGVLSGFLFVRPASFVVCVPLRVRSVSSLCSSGFIRVPLRFSLCPSGVLSGFLRFLSAGRISCALTGRMSYIVRRAAAYIAHMSYRGVGGGTWSLVIRASIAFVSSFPLPSLLPRDSSCHRVRAVVSSSPLHPHVPAVFTSSLVVIRAILAFLLPSGLGSLLLSTSVPRAPLSSLPPRDSSCLRVRAGFASSSSFLRFLAALASVLVPRDPCCPSYPRFLSFSATPCRRSSVSSLSSRPHCLRCRRHPCIVSQSSVPYFLASLPPRCLRHPGCHRGP